MGRACRTWEKRNAYRLLLGKPEGKEEQDGWRALVNAVMNLWVS
jgi:hypothetical protein